MAAALGLALGLDDEQVMKMSWAVRNASVSDFRFQADRFSLSSFNEACYLEQRLLTLR